MYHKVSSTVLHSVREEPRLTGSDYRNELRANCNATKHAGPTLIRTWLFRRVSNISKLDHTDALTEPPGTTVLSLTVYKTASFELRASRLLGLIGPADRCRQS